MKLDEKKLANLKTGSEHLAEKYGEKGTLSRNEFDARAKVWYYKGYHGTVAYSEKDQVFYGKIEGINGLVNFEGDSVKELTAVFHEAVDDYLAYCKEEGIEPVDNNWKVYHRVLNKALQVAQNGGMEMGEHFNQVVKMVKLGSGIFSPLESWKKRQLFENFQ